jgi:hypothetical protein
MRAARMSPTLTSARPELCTCSTAVCSTRRKARVSPGSFLEPAGRRSIESSRNAFSSFRSFVTSAPQAFRIFSPAGSCRIAYSRCSRVRWV